MTRRSHNLSSDGSLNPAALQSSDKHLSPNQDQNEGVVHSNSPEARLHELFKRAKNRSISHSEAGSLVQIDLALRRLGYENAADDIQADILDTSADDIRDPVNYAIVVLLDTIHRGDHVLLNALRLIRRQIVDGLIEAGFSEPGARKISLSIMEEIALADGGREWDAADAARIAESIISIRQSFLPKARSGSKAAEDFRAAASTKSAFADRDRARFPTAESYLRATFGDRLGPEGDLDQATVRKFDPALMAQLDLEFRGPERRKQLRELLPTTSERNDQKLLSTLGYIPTGEERKSALTTLSRGYTPKSKR